MTDKIKVVFWDDMDTEVGRAVLPTSDIANVAVLRDQDLVYYTFWNMANGEINFRQVDPPLNVTIEP